MRILSVLFVVFTLLPHTIAFADFPEAPEAPANIQQWMPDHSASFSEQVIEVIRKMLPSVRPEFRNAYMAGLAVFSCILLISLIGPSHGLKNMPELTGSICISFLLYRNTGTMISLASDTVTELSEYGKLFLPVITAVFAAQGGVTSSAGLYLGTSAGTAILTNLICKLMIPAVHFYLAAAIGHCTTGEELLKQIKEQQKKFSVWALKTGLSLFMTFMTITGAVNGSSDKAVLKATKAAISTVVPVIGSNLAEASEALLISAGIAKNTIGIYGIIVFLCIAAAPFFRIGIHYLILKATAVVCSVLGSKRLTLLVEDYCSALGMLLAMIGTECVFAVIGTVCFMRGIS